MNKLDARFKISERGSTMRREIIGGVTTFATMAYILIVQASLMSGTGRNVTGVMISTALMSGLITLLISGGGASGLAAMVQENGPAVFAGILILDYIQAFSSVGLSGRAARFMKSTAGALSLGAVIGLCCRFLCHFVSGFLLFGSYADWFFGQTSWGQWFLDHFSGAGLSAIYSLVYNGLYMIPEIILTAIGGAIVGRLLHTQLQKNRTTHTA